MRSRIRLSIMAIAFAAILPPAAAIAKDTTVHQLALSAKTCDTPTTPFCDALMPPLLGWPGNVFHLSQAYPGTIPQDQMPWTAYDPTTQPDKFIGALLGYFYDGNIKPTYEASFNPATNTVRGWYNAPWQDSGTNGREFAHGLTRERPSQPGELAPQQKQVWNNYAVGFYNAPGGWTLGKIWANHGSPVASLASMPEGTVAAKLLFTTASVDEVPYLQGSPDWLAYVFADLHATNFTPSSPRAAVHLRLLQIDVAVKDSKQSPKTGWVFGTFVYGGGPGGPAGSGWNNVYPVGLMWGNVIAKPDTCGMNGEGWINCDVKMPHLGYQGRLNGPVDNPISSCMSCHSTAELQPTVPMVPPNGVDPTPWFRDIQSGTPFDPAQVALDYSLQVQVGLTNFYDAQKVAKAKTPAEKKLLLQQIEKKDQVPPRDGGGSGH